MEFPGLIGNEQLKTRLSNTLAKGQLSHCYLISGRKGSGKKTLAKILAAALQCTGNSTVPCGSCAACRKVQADTHPDVITVDTPDRVTIPVDTVRQMRADAFIRPNEGKKKIYLFPRAQALNPAGQNALLKLLEEPPPYGVFFLLTDNADALLPTVRSRCVELSMAPLTKAQLIPVLKARFPEQPESDLIRHAEACGGALGRALELAGQQAASSLSAAPFAAAFAAGDALALLELTVRLEKAGREQFSATLQSWQTLLYQALQLRAGLPAASQDAQLLGEARTTRELLTAYRYLQTALEACSGNVGIGHLCGALAVQLHTLQ